MLKLREYLRKDDRWVRPNDAIFGRLWVEFLAFSPSYELARKLRAGVLTEADRDRLPADIDTVLAVYDDFGDIRQIDFDDWWLKTGIRIFGNHGEQPRIGLIDVLAKESSTKLETLMARGHDYITGRWERQGQQPSAIIAVPLGLTKTELMQQFEHILTMYDDDLKYINPAQRQYSLHGTKYDLNSLSKFLKCILTRAHFPEIPLYQVGTVAELSSTYSARVDADDTNMEDREALKILTSRALSRGMLTAENAARGIFPSYDKCRNAVAPDWAEMCEATDVGEE